jgi:signal transduction histidine kinase
LQQLDPDLLSEEQKAALGDKIQKATGSLLETMEDLLLWSKTQMNAFVPDKEETSLNPVLAQSLALLHLNTEAKNITIENNVPAGAKAWADPYFLQTIFRNLLQNAVKAAPANSKVVVNYGQDAGGDRVLIQNGGSSFTQQDYEKLLSAKEDGSSLSGLGLRLVRELSEKMGARVMFSAENGVTTAAIIFPQQ